MTGKTVVEFNLADPYMGRVGCRVVEYAEVKKGEERLLDAKERITPLTELNVLFDYPMKKPEIVMLHSFDDKGFTRLEFLRLVYETYMKTYEAPDKYGIWGHTLDQLYLESAVIDDDGSVDLGIGS